MAESSVQAEIRLRTSQAGWRLWRNNVGVLTDERGVPVRYGLANDSKAVNAHLKSGDLIGIRPVVITQDMVGMTIGQFVSIEVKAPGYKPGNTAREKAQRAWAALVTTLGGFATITDRSDWI